MLKSIVHANAVSKFMPTMHVRFRTDKGSQPQTAGKFRGKLFFSGLTPSHHKLHDGAVVHEEPGKHLGRRRDSKIAPMSQKPGATREPKQNKGFEYLSALHIRKAVAVQGSKSITPHQPVLSCTVCFCRTLWFTREPKEVRARMPFTKTMEKSCSESVEIAVWRNSVCGYGCVGDTGKDNQREGPEQGTSIVLPEIAAVWRHLIVTNKNEFAQLDVFLKEWK